MVFGTMSSKEKIEGQVYYVVPYICMGITEMEVPYQGILNLKKLRR